jgi:hypothetical protein
VYWILLLIIDLSDPMPKFLFIHRFLFVPLMLIVIEFGEVNASKLAMLSTDHGTYYGDYAFVIYNTLHWSTEVSVTDGNLYTCTNCGNGTNQVTYRTYNGGTTPILTMNLGYINVSVASNMDAGIPYYYFEHIWTLIAYPITAPGDTVKIRAYKGGCSYCPGDGIYLTWSQKLTISGDEYMYKRGIDLSVDTTTTLFVIESNTVYYNFNMVGQGSDGVGIYRIRFTDQNALTIFELINGNGGSSNDDNIFFDSLAGSVLEMNFVVG